MKEFVKENLPKASVTAVEGTYLIWLDLNGYERKIPRSWRS